MKSNHNKLKTTHIVPLFQELVIKLEDKQVGQSKYLIMVLYLYNLLSINFIKITTQPSAWFNEPLTYNDTLTPLEDRFKI